MIKIDKNRIAEIAVRYHFSLVVLFGSQATGFTHKESDVDVAFLSENKMSFEDEVSLNTDLTEVFKNDKVSTVNFRKAPPLLLKQIVQNAKVLYEKTPHLFDDMLLYALRTYEEAEPLFRLREEYLKRRISEYKYVG
ncbi:MAG TPA: hypothetical protein DEF00_05325 [Candidatus Taylorbacteria bacterium]|nr:MAG: polymerase beta domain protein region protein [Parcubacteria group bacterium GW2011_GWA2_47_64]KKU97266.1 MAG: polymerase beta domain protein region protein [Parcubacteria group bacterium GW2011_GWC2_48_17]HBV01769.1 hypothetical protein [Candidatus Taylorbacteria bacterium]